MKKQEKLTVTIGIPAFNEEKNIQLLLTSLLKQKEQGFSLKKIILFSDGSTDNTVSFARKCSSRKLEVIDNKKRVGKAQGLNYLFKTFESDILVVFDADITLASDQVVCELIAPFRRSSQVGLVSGYNEVFPTRSLLNRSIRLGYDVYEQIGRQIDNGSNPHTCSGCVLALTKAFAKSVQLPKTLYADDTYLYFACLRLGFSYAYAPLAKVFYNAATSFSDHIKQTTRFVSLDPCVSESFPQLLDKAYAIPWSLRYKLMTQAFLRHPFQAFVIFFLNHYCKMIAGKKLKGIQGKWQQATSTKGENTLFTNNKTLAIGIPACNEEKTLPKLLATILQQQEDGFVLSEIIILSDGSSDNTVQAVRAFHDRRIKVISRLKREGKASALQKILDVFDSQILCLMDADIEIKNDRFFSQLVKKAEIQKHGLVSAKSIPQPGRNFFSDVLNCSIAMQEEIKSSWNKGNNYLAFKGCFLALNRQLAKSVHLPKGLINDDAFIYFSALKRGYTPLYFTEVCLSYRSPSSFSQHLKQSSRFQSSEQELQGYFPFSLHKQYQIPKALTIKACLHAFFDNPVYLTAYIFVYLLSVLKKERKVTSNWDLVLSTKY